MSAMQGYPLNPNPQGLWEYPTIRAYVEDWVVPRLLGDLQALFEGAHQYWQEHGVPQRPATTPSVRSEPGRGDFLLATTLFAVMNHLGRFLLAPNDLPSTRGCIYQAAKLLPSTAEVPEMVSHFGRNQVVHRGWPQTLYIDDNWRRGYGLNLGANPDESDHDLMYRNPYKLPDPKTGETLVVTVFKLRLNVRVLKREIDDAVRLGRFLSMASQEVFESVARYETERCFNPFGREDRARHPDKKTEIGREFRMKLARYPELEQEWKSLQ